MAVNFFLKTTIKDGKSQIVVRVQSRKLQIDVKQGTNLFIEPNIWVKVRGICAMQMPLTKMYQSG